MSKRRAGFRRAPKKAEHEEPTDEELVTEWLASEPAFQVLTMDGLNWIDPHTGTLIPAAFGWEQAAKEWLLQNIPWDTKPAHSFTEVQELRWRTYLRKEVAQNPRLRHFDADGRWLNPYRAQWEDGIRRDGKKLTADTLKDMAAVLARDPEVQDADLVDDTKLERILQAPVDTVPEIKIESETALPTEDAVADSKPDVKKPLYAAPASGRKRMRISNTRKKLGGSSLVDGYQVLGRIGSGGMSVVYRARQLSTDREVALKIMQATGERAETFAERFMREAKAAGGISHPNVICVYDFGKAGDSLFMSMEIMSGGDAESKMVDQAAPLSEQEALPIIRDATAGLTALHDNGVIHRDIKPSNIFLDTDGTAKLGDLGLAKHGDAEFTVTVDGAAVGTPAFMAPEQARGLSELTTSVDIYAMGASLFSLLAGRPPYIGPNVYSIVRQVVAGEFPDVTSYNRAVRPVTKAIIEKATAPNPSQRFANAEEFLAAIEAAMTDCPDTAAEPTAPIVDTGRIRKKRGSNVIDPTDQFTGQDSIVLSSLGWSLHRHHKKINGCDAMLTRPWSDGYLIIALCASDDTTGRDLLKYSEEILSTIAPDDHSSPAHIANVLEARLAERDVPMPTWAMLALCESDGISVCNCGPCRPVLFARQPSLQVMEIGHADLPLGHDHNIRREQWLTVPADGLVVIASPGVHACTDELGECFDSGRIAEELLARPRGDERNQAQYLSDQLREFCAQPSTRDTLFAVLKRQPPAD